MSYYPEEPVRVIGFRYENALHLTRDMKAVQARKGEDADYIVSRYLRAVATIRTPDNRECEFPIVVPGRFLTDLSSVPKCLRWYLSRVGPHLEASVIHDWLYVAWQLSCCGEVREQDRCFADDIFLHAMLTAGVSYLKACIVYRITRLRGKEVFHDKNERIFADPSWR